MNLNFDVPLRNSGKIDMIDTENEADWRLKNRTGCNGSACTPENATYRQLALAVAVFFFLLYVWKH